MSVLPHVFASLVAGNQPALYLDDNFNALRNVTPTAQTADYTTVVADHLHAIEVTGTTKISLGDAATMVAAALGYTVIVFNKGVGTVTVSRLTGTDTFNGATKDIKLAPKQGVVCTVNSTGNGYELIAAANGVLSDAADPSKQARFDTSGIGTGTTRVMAVPNQNFTIGPFARGVISGFTYANNGTDSIDVAAGGAADSTNAYWITGAALTKNITAAWAVGTAAGMLDTGAVGNSDYYIWAIARSDTGVVDYLASLSSTAPTMPANYDFKRLIGWFKRTGGSNVAFHTYETEGGGLEMTWDVPTLDVNQSNTLTTSRRTDAVRVPLNFSVIAILNVQLNDATSSQEAWICCPDQTDAAPSTAAAPLSNYESITATSQPRQMFIRTSASGTIAARSTLATVDGYLVATMGFRWARRI